MAEKEGGFGQNVLGKLKLVGGKVVDFGGTVAGRVADVGGTVGNKIGDFGNKIVDVATKPLFESDFERLRQLNQIAQQQQDLRRKYTEQELLAVEARADLVLGQLYTGYFEPNFDPVAHELSKLTDSDNQDHIDELVERLTQGVETVSGRLSRHVNKKRDVLLAGIDRVAEIEDDLKAAFLISRSSRATLKAAAEEVQRNMRVVGQTRRKQSFMELMEVISKIKRARDLQHSLKKSQELGEYGDAIMTCVQCFQGLESLGQLTVSAELRASVQRLYLDTLRRLDGALTNICAEFDPDKYTKLLEGYLLQGIDGKALAEKVLQCFKDSIHDVTTRIVRSLLLTKPKLADRLAAGASATSALQLGYSEMLRAMPPDLLRPCLLRLLETVFDVLSSYHVMAQWHGLAVQKESQMAAAAQGMNEEDRRAQTTTAAFLAAVNDVLKVSRAEVLDTAGRRIKDMLAMDTLFKGEDFLQVVDWCGNFGAMGEAFLGGPTELRPQVMALCARFLPAYHRSNLESLTTCLNNEAWQDVGAVTGASGAVTLELDVAILHSPLYMPHWEEEGAVTSFDKWITDGNPFKRGSGQGAMPEGRQKSLVDLLNRTTAEGKQLSRNGSQQSSLGDVAAAAANGGDAAAAATCATPTTPGEEEGPARTSASSTAGEPAAATAAAVPGTPGGTEAVVEQSSSLGPAGLSGGSSSSGGAEGGGGGPGNRGPPRRLAMLTISSQQALKYMKHYGELMRPLEGYSETLYRCLTEIFDVFLLYCFSAFGGLGLEDLVWRDDLLSPRLKGALLRILIAEGSKYKPVIEELARNKPVGRGAPIASTGLGLLDRFGDKMESLADTMERSVSRMAVKLGDSKVVQVMGGSGDSSIGGGVQGSGASMVGFPQVSAPNTGMLTPLGGPRASVPMGGVGGVSGAHNGGSPGPSQGSPSSSGGSFHAPQWGLRERVVAVESLIYMAQELKAAKQAIILALPGRCQRDVEQYFNRTVEAAADLREYLFKAAARVMMQGVWDGDRGIPAAIGVTNYNVREPAIKQSPWADFSVRALHTFREKVLAARLPLPLVVLLWDFAVAVVTEGLLTGLAGVRKCSLEGRANMSFDLSHVERQIRAMGPPNFKPTALAIVDAYIKAFYLPWEELPHWCRTHVAQYGKQRLFTLVEVSAEFNKVKRHQKNEVLEMIEALDPTKSF
ncbi:hypothetical protein VOLCADRAFT_93432 [Volvox carteri f. nagariensis]|uniref:Uncharacterized protein n=1 Tax=Volvox carteri f. nagariensis TaxID=3068 RepID=D8U241_VOLCA|nr:uncharacterized protein VOLCADRAFT_93432 [Volvox carteri f. nagariensis]EFJ46296.1 hypothetical protein VOLCADRAFT_93432 [Volvox carteri f. nagariensis]|eukprot:XP_002952743.1 hypothetical protein VOLCADRAFT_93432 [Volvox carteri f. nagariensis]